MNSVILQIEDDNKQSPVTASLPGMAVVPTRFVDLVYRAPLQPALWRQVLHELCLEFDLQVSTVFVRDSQCAGKYGFQFGAMVGEGPDVSSYRQHYWRFDSCRHLLDLEREGTIYGSEHPSRQGAAETELADWYRHSPIAAGSGFFSLVLRDGQYLGHLSGANSAGSRMSFGGERCERLARFLKHVRSALSIQLELHKKDLRVEVLTEATSASRFAILVVDEQQTIRDANGPASYLLSRSAGFVLKNGKLIARQSGANEALIVALGLATRSPPLPTRMTVIWEGGGKANVLVTSLPSSSKLAAGYGQALALVVITTPDAFEAPLTRADLQALFGLTAAEARVALLLSEGRVVKQIACEQNVAISTVRSQVRAILAKTRTSRQGELIRLLRAH